MTRTGNLTGTVLRARMGFYTVETPDGLIECRLTGKSRRERQATDLVVIGDTVTLVPLSATEGMIESVDDRRTVFSRRQPGKRGTWKEDVVVANLDQLLVVFACAQPQPHVRMIDRFLIVAEHNEVEAIVVANKVDVVTEEAAHETFGPYERIGYEVHYVSARTGTGVEKLRERLTGRLSAVSGPSGVGKSTLLNAIQPGLNLDTGAVSAAVGKGMHTTVGAELHPLAVPGGGYIADTPGIRELGLWQIPDTELAWTFREMRPHLRGCRFGDCRHVAEPACEIRAAVAGGEVSLERYDSYVRLLTGEPGSAPSPGVAMQHAG